MALFGGASRLLDVVAVLCVIGLWAVLRWRAVQREQKALAPLEVRTYLFGAGRLPGALFPTTKWNPGALYTWFNRGRLYSSKNTGTFVLLSWVNSGKLICSNDMDVIRQVSGSKSVWERPRVIGMIENIPQHAHNVATGRMDTGYTRHRRIITPAFNQDLYHEVWHETVSAFESMGQGTGWNGDGFSVSDLQALNSQFTLSVIAKVGFGLDLSWDYSVIKGKGEIDLRSSFEILAEQALLRGTLPSWAFNLPFAWLQRIKLAIDYLMVTLRGTIKERRAEIKAIDANKRDILSLLIRANELETAGTGLGDDELMSNAFVMLFAGHETSSRSLTCTLGLLACHPEEQERLYQTIKDVIPDDRVPLFEDYDALKPIFDCIMETLRLYPIGPMIYREATEDTTLIVPGVDSPVFFEKGALIFGDLIGINYDSKRWPDPFKFSPARWADKHDLTAEDYISFGHGLHACLGRRFALFEMVCFLALFLRTWKVLPGEMKAGESLQAWRTRVLDDRVTIGITMGPSPVPVKLERR